MDGVTRVIAEQPPNRALRARPRGRAAFSPCRTAAIISCTFCIIPFGRGASRSVSPEEVVAQARALVASGKREIVLTGVDLTSYDADGLNARRAPASAAARGCKRSTACASRRSTASKPTTISSIALREEERLCPHLHLSLQAGDDLILKRMKRRHLRADAIRFCDALRAARPDIVLRRRFHRRLSDRDGGDVRAARSRWSRNAG